jgi:flagellar basal body-associated protein FliL
MANGEEGQAEGNKSKSRMVIWICLLVAFLVIIGAFAKMMFWSPGASGEDEPVVAPEGPGEIVALGVNGEFITNLGPPDSDSFISVKFWVELDADKKEEKKLTRKMTEELEDKKHHMQGIVEEVLRSQTRKDLDTKEGVDAMKKEILRKVNATLKEGKVRQVLPGELIIQ